MTYIADNLEDVAQHFERSASDARQLSEAAARKLNKERHLARAETWEAAARFLRTVHFKKPGTEQ